MTQFAAGKLEALSARDLRRRIVATSRRPEARVRRHGQDLISFSCNDYLGLSQHPAVIAAATRATGDHGTGAGGSRLVTGNHPLYETLEARLAAFKGSQAACVFGSGYLANVGVIPCFAGPDDLIVIDQHAHACLFAGATLSRARTERFEHNDLDHLAAILAQRRHHHPNCLVVTEGVFSMDGDVAPLTDIAALCHQNDAWLLCDDAHGLGVIGERGRGSNYLSPEPAPVALLTGTLSKALGGYGGYVCGQAAVIDWIANRARSLVYSTGLPPAAAAGALAALDIIGADPGLCRKPLDNARLFAAQLGLPAPQSCILPVIVGGAAAALEASRALEDRGYLVAAIRPPTVAPGTARLRLSFCADHGEEDVIGLAGAIRDLGLAP